MQSSLQTLKEQLWKSRLREFRILLHYGRYCLSQDTTVLVATLLSLKAIISACGLVGLLGSKRPPLTLSCDLKRFHLPTVNMYNIHIQAVVFILHVQKFVYETAPYDKNSLQGVKDVSVCFFYGAQLTTLITINPE